MATTDDYTTIYRIVKPDGTLEASQARGYNWYTVESVRRAIKQFNYRDWRSGPEYKIVEYKLIPVQEFKLNSKGEDI